jgi:uncharacterized protein YndB with AHSA1/START domain
MSATVTTSRPHLQISTPTDTTVVLNRTFNAPRRLVWEAFFTPDKMRRWMLPPPGFTITTLECDARVGGKLSVAWKTEEANPAMTLQGEFTAVAPLEHAVHTEKMALGSGESIGSLVEKHEFADKGAATAMRITQTYESKEERDGALASGMNEGMEACYQKLEALLGERT